MKTFDEVTLDYLQVLRVGNAVEVRCRIMTEDVPTDVVLERFGRLMRGVYLGPTKKPGPETRVACPCGGPMVWAELWEKPKPSVNRSGMMDPLQKTTKKIPLDPRPACYSRIPAGPKGEVRVERAWGASVSHFATCPKANEFSRGSR